MGKLDGHCLCGTVSYASDADPAFVAICHCNDCQRQTGAAHSIVVGVPADQIEISGADSLKSFTTVGEDHGTEVQRRFCGECGSPIYTENGGLPGVFILKGGTLNDTSWLAAADRGVGPLGAAVGRGRRVAPAHGARRRGGLMGKLDGRCPRGEVFPRGPEG